MVGGIITQTKRIRTKKGDPMMFATLDDLEGTVELLVFGNVLTAAEEMLAPDRIVIGARSGGPSRMRRTPA